MVNLGLREPQTTLSVLYCPFSDATPIGGAEKKDDSMSIALRKPWREVYGSQRSTTKVTFS